MSNVFQWSGPSQIARKPKRKYRAKPADSATRTDRVLKDRFNGTYSKAVASKGAT